MAPRIARPPSGPLQGRSGSGSLVRAGCSRYRGGACDPRHSRPGRPHLCSDSTKSTRLIEGLPSVQEFGAREESSNRRRLFADGSAALCARPSPRSTVRGAACRHRLSALRRLLSWAYSPCILAICQRTGRSTSIPPSPRRARRTLREAEAFRAEARSGIGDSMTLTVPSELHLVLLNNDSVLLLPDQRGPTSCGRSDVFTYGSRVLSSRLRSTARPDHASTRRGPDPPRPRSLPARAPRPRRPPIRRSCVFADLRQRRLLEMGQISIVPGGSLRYRGDRLPLIERVVPSRPPVG